MYGCQEKPESSPQEQNDKWAPPGTERSRRRRNPPAQQTSPFRVSVRFMVWDNTCSHLGSAALASNPLFLADPRLLTVCIRWLAYGSVPAKPTEKWGVCPSSYPRMSVIVEASLRTRAFCAGLAESWRKRGWCQEVLLLLFCSFSSLLTSVCSVVQFWIARGLSRTSIKSF